MYVRGLLQGAAKAGSEPIAMHAFNACMATQNHAKAWASSSASLGLIISYYVQVHDVCSFTCMVPNTERCQPVQAGVMLAVMPHIGVVRLRPLYIFALGCFSFCY